MNHWFDQLRTQADRQPWLAVGIGVVAATVAGAVLWRMAGAVRRSVQGRVSSVLILIAALMALPVIAASRLAWSLASTMLLSMAIGLASVLAGVTISHYGDLAPGGVIVLVAAGAFALAAGARALGAQRA